MSFSIWYNTPIQESVTNQTGTITGKSCDLEVPRTYPIAVITTGSGVSGGTITLEGSLDGVSWYTIATSTALSASSTTVITDQTPARYVRAVSGTAISGGNVTVKVSAGN